MTWIRNFGTRFRDFGAFTPSALVPYPPRRPSPMRRSPPPPMRRSTQNPFQPSSHLVNQVHGLGKLWTDPAAGALLCWLAGGVQGSTGRHNGLDILEAAVQVGVADPADDFLHAPVGGLHVRLCRGSLPIG